MESVDTLQKEGRSIYLSSGYEFGEFVDGFVRDGIGD